MGRYLIASEENLAYLAHYGIKGMKWGKHKILDALYDNSAERSKASHFKASAQFEMDEKTKKSPMREYRGTTVDGDRYEYDPIKGTFKVYPKEIAMDKTLSTEEAIKKWMKETREAEKRVQKKYGQKVQKINVYY